MEKVTVTALLKKLREGHVDIDEVAKTYFEQRPPDKHKDSARFMGPLAEELFQVMRAQDCTLKLKSRYERPDL